MKITELEDKIVYFEDFFKRVSSELQKKTGFTRLHFLMLDNKNKNFVTQYSTHGLNINFTKKEIKFLSNEFKKNIFYPKILIRWNSFLNQIFFKIYWKIRLRNTSAIIPIYRDREIICLILFSDRLADDWLVKHSHYVSVFQREIINCLDAIIFYNQTLEGIIKEYDHSDKQPVGHVDQPIDKQFSVLLGKKVKILR